MSPFSPMVWVKRHPRAGLKLAEFAARMRMRVLSRESLSPAPPRKVLESLLGPMPRRELRRLRLDFTGKAERRLVMERMLQEGDFSLLRPLVRWEHAERILDPLASGTPVIAVTWHVGPFAALGVGIETLEVPLTLVLSEEQQLARAESWEAVVVRDREGGALAFRKCVDRLKAGGVVALAGDRFTFGEDGDEAMLLGTPVRVMRGFASMARLARARIVPVGLEWTRAGDLLFRAQQPLPATETRGVPRVEYEARVIREFMQRVDRSMRERPSEIDGAIFEILLEVRRHRAEVERRWKRRGAARAARAAAGETGGPKAEGAEG